MQDVSNCPKCKSENAYFDGQLFNCPDCAHVWNNTQAAGDPAPETTAGNNFCDAYGNLLVDGDSVTVIKDLKVKGASSSVKVGTKVKNIRLVDSSDGHNIACKIEGFGAMNLKSEFVKKA